MIENNSNWSKNIYKEHDFLVNKNNNRKEDTDNQKNGN